MSQVDRLFKKNLIFTKRVDRTMSTSKSKSRRFSVPDVTRTEINLMQKVYEPYIVLKQPGKTGGRHSVKEKEEEKAKNNVNEWWKQWKLTFEKHELAAACEKIVYGKKTIVKQRGKPDKCKHARPKGWDTQAMKQAMKEFNKDGTKPWGDKQTATKNCAYFLRKWKGMVGKAEEYLEHKQKQSALDLDSPLNKVKTQSKIKKKKKLPIINEDISVSYSQMDDMNSIMLLDKRENVIGMCSGKIQCLADRDCLSEYQLGIDVLVATASYNMIVYGQYLANECNTSTVTIDLTISFVCGMIPTTTLQPSGSPTTPTTEPTTGAPTRATAQPTPDPTADHPDGGGAIVCFVLSQLFNSRGSYSLIFMAQSVAYVDLTLDTLLEWPLQRSAIESIRQINDETFCVDDGANCTTFWKVTYSANCPLMLSGSEWKVQFETSCVYQDQVAKTACNDHLAANEVTQNRIVLYTQNEFEFEDDLCVDGLYSVDATSTGVIFYKHNRKTIRTEGNLKYREGDTVYLSLGDVVLSDGRYVVDQISFENVFACHLNETAFGESESGIGACVVQQQMYLLESRTDEETQTLSFVIPKGVKQRGETLTIQIQTVLSITNHYANVNRRVLLQEGDTPHGDQVRYFMTTIVLNGKANAMTEEGLSGAGIAALIIAIIALCIVVFLAIYCLKKKDEEKEETRVQIGVETAPLAPSKLEAVKSIESGDGDIETCGIDLAEDDVDLAEDDAVAAKKKP
eukprot:46245_1